MKKIVGRTEYSTCNSIINYQVTSDLDALLFNLLILGELTDERGRIWRKSSYDLYILEITYLSHQVCHYYLAVRVLCCSGQRSGF